MKKFSLLILSSLIGFSACGQTRAEESGGTLEIFKIPAVSLGQTVFEDYTNKTIVVYTPEGYTDSTNRYPVVYYLAGFNGSGKDSANWVELEIRMNRAIESGSIPPMIVVMSDARNRLGGAFYVNSPLTGNYEDFIVDDLVNYIDENYRTIPDRSSRGICGHSMGGFGCLHIAMRNPDVFSCVFGANPGLYDTNGLVTQHLQDEGYITEFLNYSEEFSSYEGRDYAAQVKLLENTDGELSFSFAYGAAFCPETNGSPYVIYPYDEDGNLNEEALAAWESGFGNVQNEAEEYYENWTSLTAIRVDSGSNDIFGWIPEGCRYFYDVMTNEGLTNVILAEYAGDHGTQFPDRFESELMPFFAEHLKFADHQQP